MGGNRCVACHPHDRRRVPSAAVLNARAENVAEAHGAEDVARNTGREIPSFAKRRGEPRPMGWPVNHGVYAYQAGQGDGRQDVTDEATHPDQCSLDGVMSCAHFAGRVTRTELSIG